MAKSKYKVESEEVVKIKTEFFNKIKRYILENYEPALDFREPGVVLLSTNEIFFNIHLLFPSGIYDASDVAIFLDQSGFTLFEVKDLRFEWVMKPKKN